MPDCGVPQKDYTGVSTDQLAMCIQREIDAGQVTLECLAHRISCTDHSEACDVRRKLRRVMSRQSAMTGLDLADKISMALYSDATNLAVMPMANRGAAKKMALDEWWCLWQSRQVLTELPTVKWLRRRIRQLDASRESILGINLEQRLFLAGK